MLSSNLPALDLHGETRETARILIDQFISDNIKLGNYKVLIIHGVGKGIIRQETQAFLRKDKRIEKFYIDFFNIGCTVVEIRNVKNNWQEICFVLLYRAHKQRGRVLCIQKKNLEEGIY